MLNLLEVALAAKTRIKVILKERPEVDLFKWVFLVCRHFLGSSHPFALLFATANVVNQRNSIFQFLKYRILDHLLIDHVFKLKFVERKNADHLHESRRKDLSLRDSEVKFGLQ